MRKNIKNKVQYSVDQGRQKINVINLSCKWGSCIWFCFIDCMHIVQVFFFNSLLFKQVTVLQPGIKNITLCYWCFKLFRIWLCVRYLCKMIFMKSCSQIFQLCFRLPVLRHSLDWRKFDLKKVLFCKWRILLLISMKWNIYLQN
jgi:hypothetical protein